MAISGHTRVAGVIGDPIGHSLSPTIFNAAFEATGLDWVYLAFPTAAGQAEAAVGAMPVLGLSALTVTMPHKAAVIPALDRVTPVAERLGSVNAIWPTADGLLGDSTDGPGFIDSLRLDEGFDPTGARCVILGGGGAARAIALALGDGPGGAQAMDVAVVNRTASRAVAAAELAGAPGRLGDAILDIAAADLIVNATSVGMSGVEPDAIPLDPALLHAGQVVVDIVYHPFRTPLLAAAREQGAVAVSGLGMLVHQAGHAFRRFTGEDPPLAAMSAAALAELRESG